MNGILELKEEIAQLRRWEERAVKSMDAASKAAGVEVCDQIPEAIERLRAELRERMSQDVLDDALEEWKKEIEQLRTKLQYVAIIVKDHAEEMSP